ncbi:response regulator transcription factor [Nocardia asteroides]|uniref:response regulator transcription factor n=1 Tax=Nocardia asteroides TaxID=1824 RepID=UPI0033C4DCE1
MAKKSLKLPFLPDGARIEFFRAMQELVLQAGDPSTGALGDRTGYSHQAVYKALTGPKMPSERITESIAVELGGSTAVERVRRLWSAGVAEQRDALQTDPERSDVVRSADSRSATALESAATTTSPAAPAEGLPPVKVVLIARTPLLAEGLRSWCAGSSEIEVIAAVDQTDDQVRSLDALPECDVMVVELRFDGDGSKDTALVGRLCEGVEQVIVITTGDTHPRLVLDSLDMGVHSFHGGEVTGAVLTDAIESAARNRPYVSSAMAKAMHSGPARHSVLRPRLSQREQDVLLAWFQTESKAEVAKQLYISPGTVDTYLARIRTKYAAAGRPAPTKAALVAQAIRDGLITAEEL